ncbi:MAG: hypothetical protein F7C07_07065, partial [Desulfurococcales archaeon]|nr:hypothetical protein [Desulfurococcales archaeon]
MLARAWLAALVIALILLPIAPHAVLQDWVTPSLVLDSSPHMWERMAYVLLDRLYDPSLRLFKETWGTPEGRCWYWNTEQGEAAQILVYLNNETVLADVLNSYKAYLTYDNGTHVYLFSRYTPCSKIRVLSTDPRDFSLGNLIVNIGGDLAGNRTDNGNYTRVIAISLDIYKDPNNVYEQDKAWPNLWYTANLKAPEVWYLLPNQSSDYKGIWDTSDGSLGTGRIIAYSIAYNSTHANATRVMSDGNLTFVQEFILEPRAPWVTVRLKVVNNSTENMTNVRVTLAFDNLDWWLYQVVYIPGVGYINASTSGAQISSSEKEYHLARTWEGLWRPVTDSSGRSWWPSIIYANRPLGMNRALLVLVNASYGVNFWGYGNLQAPQRDLYGVPAYTDWYYRWLKYEVVIGDLAPNETRVVEARIIPMASYAPGMEGLYIEMASKLGQLMGRDWSYAVNTGTGAFKGMAMAKILLGYLRKGDYQFAQRVIDTVGSVMEGWGWKVATRALSNYILGLVFVYDYTRDQSYLSKAASAAQILLGNQVRDPGDPRNGGFLDIVYPFGVATYLDVNAEAAHALLALYERTRDQGYKEPVDYMLQYWFRKEQGTGRWYYYRYRSLQGSPGEYWYKGYLDEKQPYAQGYFLQALVRHYWGDERLLVSANKIWGFLSDEYWVLTWEGADETNVETQSSTAAGLRDYLWVLVMHMGAGVEYVRGATVRGISYEKQGSLVEESTGIVWTQAKLQVDLDKPFFALATLALYFPSGVVDRVLVGGFPAAPVSSLQELYLTPESYYWDNQSKILYVRLQSESTVTVFYKWSEAIVSNIFEPIPPT